MKILMLTPYLPYPLLTGGQTRSFNLIKRLAALGNEITLFCLIKDELPIHKDTVLCRNWYLKKLAGNEN